MVKKEFTANLNSLSMIVEDHCTGSISLARSVIFRDFLTWIGISYRTLKNNGLLISMVLDWLLLDFIIDQSIVT